MKNLLRLGESIPDDSSFETLSTFQDTVCPRCTCVHRGAGRLEGSTISASILDHNVGELVFVERLCSFS